MCTTEGVLHGDSLFVELLILLIYLSWVSYKILIFPETTSLFRNLKYKYVIIILSCIKVDSDWLKDDKNQYHLLNHETTP